MFWSDFSMVISTALKELYYCDLGTTLDSWSTSVSPSHLAYRPLSATILKMC